MCARSLSPRCVSSLLMSMLPLLSSPSTVPVEAEAEVERLGGEGIFCCPVAAAGLSLQGSLSLSSSLCAAEALLSTEGLVVIQTRLWLLRPTR